MFPALHSSSMNKYHQFMFQFSMSLQMQFCVDDHIRSFLGLPGGDRGLVSGAPWPATPLLPGRTHGLKPRPPGAHLHTQGGDENPPPDHPRPGADESRVGHDREQLASGAR